jgi:hypothetical protein
MRYLKVNEAFNDESTNKRAELQEFSNDYLAYLIDDEWSVSVWGFTTSYKIVLLSPRSVKRNRVHHDDVQWSSVKNHIIPFVQILSNRYQVGYEGSSTIIRIEASYSDDIHIRNINQLEELSDDMLFYSFSIVVKKDDMKHLKMFNESLDPAELKDFVESCLAYLLDDGFKVFIPYGSSGTSAFRDEPISIWLSIYDTGLANTTSFTWDQIKEHYIPLLQLLSNRYEILGFGESSRGFEDTNAQIRFRLNQGFSSDAFKDFPLYKVVNDTLFDDYSYEPTIYSVGIMIREKFKRYNRDNPIGDFK